MKQGIADYKLVEDDVCRACWHGDHATKVCGEVDPFDINPYGHECPCAEYIDADTSGRIIVKLETPA